MQQIITLIFFLFAILSCSKEKKEIIPSKNYNSLEWAKYIHNNPGGEGPKNDETAKAKAEEFRSAGFQHYKNKNDMAAVEAYYQALDHYASAQIYFNLGNSLSNLTGRLPDSIQAYTIAKQLDPTYPDLDYNLACALARSGKNSDAFLSLQAAYKKGKSLEVMRNDSDLQSIRKQENWEDIVKGKTSVDESKKESPAGKMFGVAAGGGNSFTYFCGKAGDQSGRLVDEQGSDLRTGEWKMEGSSVHMHYTNHKGLKGIGKPVEGPRGPEYSKYQPFEKKINQSESVSFSELENRGLREIQGECPY